MVKVTFFNLLRSKYNIKQFNVVPGTINEIIEQIVIMYPEIDISDFKLSVVFINNNKVIDHYKFFTKVKDGDEITFTHFVGGG